MRVADAPRFDLRRGGNIMTHDPDVARLATFERPLARPNPVEIIGQGCETVRPEHGIVHLGCEIIRPKREIVRPGREIFDPKSEKARFCWVFERFLGGNVLKSGFQPDLPRQRLAEGSQT